MKKQQLVMGMPSSIEIADRYARTEDINDVFNFFRHIDRKFSTYKSGSEMEKINRGEIKEKDFSPEMKLIMSLCQKTKQETKGYFDIHIGSKIDPSGIVKGYAIKKGADMLQDKGYRNFFVEIGGDIQIHGYSNACTESLLKVGTKWKVGLQNPFNKKEIIKVLYLTDKGIATSGNYIRGKHIYNPIRAKAADEIVSISVVGPDVYEADRFATAAFAMGEKGIEFIATLPGFEAYMVTKDKRAVFTRGFEKYLVN
ncbi:FAD:protein FMN transferase [Patescibacteria group bacterium]|nr:FAD:protein FMN transferase [Patescibacteria group bacterium]